MRTPLRTIDTRSERCSFLLLSLFRVAVLLFFAPQHQSVITPQQTRNRATLRLALFFVFLSFHFLLQFCNNLHEFLNLLVQEGIVAFQFFVFGNELGFADAFVLTGAAEFDGDSEVPHVFAARRSAEAQ